MSKNFVTTAREAQQAWKQESTILPDAARGDGRYGKREYPFCLPRELALHNVLPEAQIAVLRFADAGISWHKGVRGGPTNHLCSSQIQCVNSLAPFVDAPEALKALFGDALGIDHVVPFGDPLAPDDHVVFEWCGTSNLLDEWHGDQPTRGANVTSSDAAMRYKANDGKTELALIEWKYVESYLGSKGLHGDERSMATRDKRYRHHFDNTNGPLLRLVDYHDLYVEPVYQLMRLSLLAWLLEGEHEADRVRVVVCAPAANGAYWASLNRASHKLVNDTEVTNVGQLWSLMQRIPERFVVVDTARFVAGSAPTSDEFKLRYGHLSDPLGPDAIHPFHSV
jgi:Restriction Endonuclease associating with ARP